MKKKAVIICLLMFVFLFSTAYAATVGEMNALKSAESYLSIMAFSGDGLIKQLEFEGYSKNEAEYAVQHCGADWMEQAVNAAKSYISIMPFSTKGLTEQLEYDGFTPEQAAYGAAHCNDTETGSANQFQQALKSAQSYLNYSGFSFSGLIEQLEFEGYSTEEATYAAENCKADWMEQAARSAESYLSCMSFSKSELISQLIYEGFTFEQAVYGAEQNGYK